MLQSKMPEFAPFVVLAFLGTAGLLAASAAGTAGALLLGKRRLARILAGAGFAAGAGYFGVLLAFSFLSQEQTLRPGGRKYFCEIDCHLAYSVAAVAVHPGARGRRYEVEVKAWFDPDTIAPFRGDSPLTADPRIAFLEDSDGRRYAASPGALRSLNRPLRPGESCRASLDFEVASDAVRPRLFLGDPPGVENLLIGHENSLFHRKIYFELPPPAGPAPPAAAGAEP